MPLNCYKDTSQDTCVCPLDISFLHDIMIVKVDLALIARMVDVTNNYVERETKMKSGYMHLTCCKATFKDICVFSVNHFIHT